MEKLITSSNIALFEYLPTNESPYFDLDKKGVLFVHGYSILLIPGAKPIGMSKRYDLGLKGYTALGTWNDQKSTIEGDVMGLITKSGINPKYCLVMMKTKTLDEP